MPLSQGLLRVGQRRLAILSELAILVTPGGVFDERHPQAHNPQLLLIVVHWLSGLLEAPPARKRMSAQS